MPPSVSTLAELARLAKVSTATVSMSLRGRPGVAAETRARIVTLAAELGYRPNPFVSALMRTRRSPRRTTTRPTLAIVHGLERADAWRRAESTTRRQIFQGVVARAEELGYTTREFWLHETGISPERFSRVLQARGIHGIVLGPLRDGEALPPLRWELFSAIAVSVPISGTPLHVVCNDHYFSSYTAVAECYRLGYRRPGLVMRRSHRLLFQGRWEAGCVAAQRAQPDAETVAPLLLPAVEKAADFDVRALRRWLQRERPDAVVSSAAPVVEQVLQSLGWRVPGDIGLAGLSCPEFGNRLSGICQNGQLIGATAVDQLVHRLERNERGLPKQAISVMVEGVWNPGETLRPQPGRVA